MQRSSATTGLVAYDSCVLQDMVGVLSDPEQVTAMFASGHMSRQVASRRTRAASLRSELVSAPPGFLSNIYTAMMSDRQG